MPTTARSRSCWAGCCSASLRQSTLEAEFQPPLLPAAQEPAEQPPQAAEAVPAASTRSKRIWIYLGRRSLDEDDWSPLEDQATFGLEFSMEAPDSAIGWEIGLMGSGTSETVLATSVDATTGEFYGGVRKTFMRDTTIQPYFGAGVSFITAKLEGGGVSDDDSSLGFYGHGGATAQLGQSFQIGLDLRTLFGTDVNLFGVDADVDYFQLAIVLGWLL